MHTRILSCVALNVPNSVLRLRSCVFFEDPAVVICQASSRIPELVFAVSGECIESEMSLRSSETEQTFGPMHIFLRVVWQVKSVDAIGGVW